MVTLPALLEPTAVHCVAKGLSCHQPPASQGTIGTIGCSLGFPLVLLSRRGTQGSMAGDTINVWGAWRSLQGVATASNPLLPRGPRRAALGLFMAPLAAGLLGFAGCGPGSLIPPIIYLIQTLCLCGYNCVRAAALPNNKYQLQSPRDTALPQPPPPRRPCPEPDTPARGVRASGCDTPALARPGHCQTPPSAPREVPGQLQVTGVMGWGPSVMER